MRQRLRITRYSGLIAFFTLNFRDTSIVAGMVPMLRLAANGLPGKNAGFSQVVAHQTAQDFLIQKFLCLQSFALGLDPPAHPIRP